MNVEILHDALNLLPGDLVTAVDRLRSAPRKKPIRWPRFATIAACAALVLWGGAVMAIFLSGMGGLASSTAENSSLQLDMSANSVETPAEGAPESKENSLTPTGYPVQFGDISAAQYCLTPVDSTLCIDRSAASLIRSREELDTHCQDLDTLREACTAYDDAWFAEQDLVMICLDVERSELRPQVQSLMLTGDDAAEVTVTFTEQPEDNAPDPACWHILLPVQKGLIADVEDITVLFP